MKRVLRHLLYPIYALVEVWFTFFFLLLGVAIWLNMKVRRKGTPEYRLAQLYAFEQGFWEATWWGTKVDHTEILRLARRVVRSDWWSDRDYDAITLVDSSLAHGMGSSTVAYVNSRRPMQVRLCKKEISRYVILHEVGHSLQPHDAHKREWLRAYFGLVRRHVGLRTAICLYLVTRPWVSEANSVPDKDDKNNG